MLDLRLIREQPEQVKAAVASLFTEAPIDEIIATDERRRSVLTEVEQLKAERNEGSKLVTKAKDAEERQQLIAKMRALGERIDVLDDEVREINDRLLQLQYLVPNLPFPEVPVGADE